MDLKAALTREAAYEPAVRSFVRSVNQRSGRRPAPGQTWVRVRPPNEDEIVDECINPKLVRFHRLGSAARITVALADFVEIICAGETTMVGVPDFMESWARLLDDAEWGR